MKEIAAALFKFQQEVGKVTKDALNPFFKSKYATLSNVLEVIKEPLKKCGLVIVQSPTFGTAGAQDTYFLKTEIIHAESGHSIESFYMLNPVKNDPQSIGSAITYARRYAIVAMLCLDVDDDDDGIAASKPQPTPSEQQAFKEQVDGASKPKQGDYGFCTKCNARNVKNPKTGKIFCEKKCWLNEVTNVPPDPTDDF